MGANIWDAILAVKVARCESSHEWPNPEVLLSLSSDWDYTKLEGEFEPSENE